MIGIYAPVAHWVWGGGFLAKAGALDFAGGAVVHVNAAAAALVAALVIGPRRDYGRHAMLPHNVPFTLLGAGLLWFGWFGFNAGSALGANPTAALAFTNTLLAPAATLATWVLIDLFRGGRVTAVGGATAIVVGLVVVTPAAGYVAPASALALGALGAVPSYFALIYRARTGLDDSLDVVAAHGMGGATGAILTGVFADAAWSGGANGLIAGHPGQVLIQLASVAGRAGLQRCRHVRHPQAAGSAHAAPDQPADRKRRAGRDRAWRRGLHRGRRRHPRVARRSVVCAADGGRSGRR